MGFEIAILGVALLAGAIASVTGFGIGSLLTPLFAVRLGTKVAVACVAVPHFVATAYRCWVLRKEIDRNILIKFGSMSALGGLVGAALNFLSNNGCITIIFGVLMICAGLSGLFNGERYLKFEGARAWIAGALSGVFGGLVGNQGGIRSAALLGVDHLSKNAFVATATATGVMVDLARIPIYALLEGQEIQAHLDLIGIATLGAFFGTVAGVQCLSALPEELFRKVVSVAILLLGLATIFKAICLISVH